MKKGYWFLAGIAIMGLMGLTLRDATLTRLIGPSTVSGSDAVPVAVDSSTGGMKAYLSALIEGENQTLHRMMTAPKFTCNQYTSDQTAIVTGAGVLEGVYFNSINSADDIVIYDNTANSGTAMITVTNLAAGSNYTLPQLGYTFSTGLSVDVTFNAGSTVTLCYLP